jgi:DNA-damage-inducible protein D
MEDKNLMPFDGSAIRKLWHNEQWFFSVVDIIGVLTDSVNPRNYWTVLKKREPQLSTICIKLKLPSKDGKNYQTDCALKEFVENGLIYLIMT